ncbi:alkanal monooxygenase subunit alpha [Corynebacterium renale]|nr:alkanal monooxygenase subunit alpha [Corynebacterium renale]
MFMSTPSQKLSLIDFCTVYENERPAQSIARSVALAQEAEALGYYRMWYAEHHNMKSISSSSPAVLIAHVGAQTSSIRLGAGGVMLPNHSPYVVAEQFGMLEEMYPNRIDLGLGRAPGTDQHTLGRALRRDPHAAENFPNDVVELQGYLSDNSVIPGIRAVPGYGTNVPLIILGSSMFGARLAAQLGLPYAFASHFAPSHLEAATTWYRENYQPSEQFPEPYLIAALNVTAAETQEEAEQQHHDMRRMWVRQMAGRGRGQLTEEQLDQVMDSLAGQQILDMRRYTAVGDGPTVRAYLENFAERIHADELMVALQAPTGEKMSTTMEILSDAWELERRS